MIHECSQHYIKRYVGPRSQLSVLWTVFKEREPCYATSKEDLTVGTFWLCYSCCCWLAKSCLTLCDPVNQHTRLHCPAQSPRVCSDSCPLNRGCYLTVSSSAAPFSFCLQYFPASGSSHQVAKVLEPQHQSFQWIFKVEFFKIDGFALLAVQGALRSLLQHPTIWKYESFDVQPSLWSNSHICTWLLENT